MSVSGIHPEPAQKCKVWLSFSGSITVLFQAGGMTPTYISADTSEW